jgi:hypothetical protein
MLLWLGVLVLQDTVLTKLLKLMVTIEARSLRLR